MFFQVLGHFILDRRLQLPGSFAEQLFQVALGLIFGSLFERNHFSFIHRCIFSFGASSVSVWPGYEDAISQMGAKCDRRAEYEAGAATRS
jgi:hypothetical protein